MSTTRSLVASLIFFAATAPAYAGGFGIEHAAVKGELAPIDGCAYSRAVTVLTGNAMRVVADVPRTRSAYRFVVDWKEQLFAVTVRTSDCGIKVVGYAAAIQPYCAYVPGIRIACQIDQLAQ